MLDGVDAEGETTLPYGSIVHAAEGVPLFAVLPRGGLEAFALMVPGATLDGDRDLLEDVAEGGSGDDQPDAVRRVAVVVGIEGLGSSHDVDDGRRQGNLDELQLDVPGLGRRGVVGHGSLLMLGIWTMSIITYKNIKSNIRYKKEAHRKGSSARRIEPFRRASFLVGVRLDVSQRRLFQRA